MELTSEIAWVLGGLFVFIFVVFIALAIAFPEFFGIQGKVAKKVEGED